MKKNEKEDPFGSYGCHDCPAGGDNPEHIERLVRQDDAGEPLTPADMIIACHAGPKVPLFLGVDKGSPIVKFVRPQMGGDEYCYLHPAIADAMDPVAYGPPEEEGDDEEDEDYLDDDEEDDDDE